MRAHKTKVWLIYINMGLQLKNMDEGVRRSIGYRIKHGIRNSQLVQESELLFNEARPYVNRVYVRAKNVEEGFKDLFRGDAATLESGLKKVKRVGWDRSPVGKITVYVGSGLFVKGFADFEDTLHLGLSLTPAISNQQFDNMLNYATVEILAGVFVAVAGFTLIGRAIERREERFKRKKTAREAKAAKEAWKEDFT